MILGLNEECKGTNIIYFPVIFGPLLIIKGITKLHASETKKEKVENSKPQ